MEKHQCMFCSKPATLLCDGILGYDADTDEDGHMTAVRKLQTCDAPLCRACATWRENIFFSGRAGGMETRDYCPLCQQRKETGVATPARCFGDEQAVVIRQAHWAKVVGKKQRCLDVVQGGGQQQLPF
ncbi:hypothetical protein [Serratia fonticola]|uniref:hypothetical protein n=1 Tax=Serratia fonticola TaxID=47917 RepID=UPI00301C1061